MARLISKIQYKNFETGEFIEEKERAFEEIIELIEQFPWEIQRERIVIDLTNPSITIQGKNDDYLKLALFYNGKFVLHYFDQEQTLNTKSFSEIKDSYKYIKNYFVSSVFDTADFKKENTLFQSNQKHFLSQDFHYQVTPKSARKYLLSTCGISLAFTIIVGLLLSVKPNFPLNAFSIAIILLLIFFIGGGINLILFFKYYLYAKNKILIMSRGNEIFYFGNKENPTRYLKTDIIRFTISQVKNSKHPISNFALVTIELYGGTEIEIPNILVDHLALEYKLSGISMVEKNTFPALKA